MKRKNSDCTLILPYHSINVRSISFCQSLFAKPKSNCVGLPKNQWWNVLNKQIMLYCSICLCRFSCADVFICYVKKTNKKKFLSSSYVSLVTKKVFLKLTRMFRFLKSRECFHSGMTSYMSYISEDQGILVRVEISGSVTCLLSGCYFLSVASQVRYLSKINRNIWSPSITQLLFTSQTICKHLHYNWCVCISNSVISPAVEN